MLTGLLLYRYTEADNSVVVATDSIKNTIFILAKQHPVTPPELFGSIIASHFTTTYKHIHAAFVNIVTHRWTRLNIDGKAHPHSFIKDSQETRNIDVEHHEGQGFTITSGIKDLSVLKSTGSAFHGFVRDEYTTLKEAWDRILSTDVDSTWKWTNFKDLAAIQDVIPKFDAAWAAARDITLDLFAKENSPSVQATMYNMSNAILAAEPLIETVSYSLPNKHYFELGMSRCSPLLSSLTLTQSQI